MALEAGHSLLHYRLVDKIGEGGMGVVWRATDTSLDREVAIKVLPEAFAADAERLARFEREARTLASLNHPGIAAVYGLHEAGGLRFLAMELVDGEDLSQRLQRGPVAVDEALGLAGQIADAIEAAHEAGVIHRDLKPANVVVGATGKIKVLDFGLAKAMSADPASGTTDPSLSPTITATGTAVGMILGTAAYMSPEQAKGRAVDRRADIWSFGVLLYEMLSGRRLFGGETVSETLASVLKDEVRWDALPPGTPPVARRLLRRCLDRDPATRLRDIGEARVALANVDEDPAEPAARPRSIVPWAAACLVLALAGVAAGWFLRPVPRPEVRKLDVAARNLEVDDLYSPQLSPDGRRVAYFVAGKLYVRDLDRDDSREIPESAGARNVSWSPDGSEVVFHRIDSLFRATVDGGAPVRIARTGNHVPGAGGCWSKDERIVYSRGNTALFEVSARGGEPRVLLEPDDAKDENHFHRCAFLPGDRALIYVVHPNGRNADTIGLLADGRSRHILTLDNEILSLPTWSPSGHIVFHRAAGVRDGIWALPFDLARLEPTGDPFQVVEGAAVPSASSDGSLLYAPRRSARTSRLVWVLPDGTVEKTAIQFDHEVDDFALSPDGKKVAATVVVGGIGELWTVDLERGTRTRLITEESWASRPDWSRDGSSVAYGQIQQIRIVDAAGEQDPRTVGEGEAPNFVQGDRSILTSRSGAEGLFGIWLLSVSGEDPERRLFEDTVSTRWPRVSPDGRFVAYVRGDAEQVVFLTRFPEGRGRWQVSAADGSFVRWADDGKALYYVGRGPDEPEARYLFEVEFQSEPEIALGVPRPLFSLIAAGVRANYDVAPSGDRFLMHASERGDAVDRLVLVQNWFEEFD